MVFVFPSFPFSIAVSQYTFPLRLVKLMSPFLGLILLHLVEFCYAASHKRHIFSKVMDHIAGKRTPPRKGSYPTNPQELQASSWEVLTATQP